MPLVLFMATTSAYADPKDKPDAEAARMFHEAVAAANQARDDKAIALLLAAVARDPQPDYIANLGVCEMNAKHYRDAAEHLAFYLRTVRTMSDEDRALIEGMLKKAEAQLGWMTVHVDVAGADIFIDDKHVGVSPLSRPVYVDAGKRKVQVLKDNLGHSRVVDVGAGSKPVLEILIAPPPALKVITNQVTDKPSTPPPNTRNKKIIYAGIASSAVLGAIGIGTTIGASNVAVSSYERWLDNQCTRAKPDCLSEFEDAQTTKAILGNTAVVAFVGGGIIGLATTIYALRGSKKPAPPKVSVTFSANEWSIGWRGTF